MRSGVASVSKPTSGPALFARYAYPPNRLGLCGPDDAPGLLHGGERELRSLALGFEGAYPYLRLIAEQNGIEDPLDRRVVEAYWIGSALTRNVKPAALHRDVLERFRPRMAPDEWRWLTAALEAGSRPVHAFHVLEIFPRVGLLRGGSSEPLVGTMDSCRIRWGRVERVVGDRLLVRGSHLELSDGTLVLGTPRLDEVSAWSTPNGPLDGVAAGDWVSLHWGWACDALGARQLARLAAWTDAAISSANRSC